MKKKKDPSAAGLALFVFAALLLSGCHQTYPEDRIAEQLESICRTEYGIKNIQVKSVGRTIGVFLPLDQLFNIEQKDLLALSKVQNLESLLQPSEKALEQVEDVLFTTSRVVLSTDKKIDFYVLQATDVKLTGLQLVLTGYVDDIKRVRLWDIPRSEYRKRVLHELRLNKSILWARPIYGILDSLGKKSADELIHSYFVDGIDEEALSPSFLMMMNEAAFKRNLSYEWLDARSETGRKGEAFVYVKLRERYQPKPGTGHKFLYPSGTVLDAVFVIYGKLPTDSYIRRVIPFFYVDEKGEFQKVDFPQDLKLDESLTEWPLLFEMEEVKLGDFLAKQLARRMEAILSSDERIFNTFYSARLDVEYATREMDQEPFFMLNFDIEQKNPGGGFSGVSWTHEEDVTYMLNLVLREFVTVIRAYRFDDFDHFEVNNIAIPSSAAILQKADLELFRKGKVRVQELLHPAVPSF